MSVDLPVPKCLNCSVAFLTGQRDGPDHTCSEEAFVTQTANASDHSTAIRSHAPKHRAFHLASLHPRSRRLSIYLS